MPPTARSPCTRVPQKNLTITSSSPGFAALGFNTTVTAARTGGGTAGTGFVIGNDVQTFDNESISGGAVTVYNAAGTPINIQLRWAKTDSASLGNPHVDTWNLFYQNDPNATGSQVAWTNVGTNFIFNANGSLTSPTGSAIQIPGVTVGGQSLGALSFNISSGALTQFASTGGAATIGTITQNGFAAGQLQSVAINNSGLVVGTFSNGQNVDLASSRSRISTAPTISRHSTAAPTRSTISRAPLSSVHRDGSSVRRSKARTPTSRTNSPS